MDEELDKLIRTLLIRTLSNERGRLCDVLDRLGEKALSESFKKAFELTGSLVEPVVEPILVHDNTGNSLSDYGAIFFFGLNELPDGTITDSGDGMWNTPKETVTTEADIVPAARRLMKRILSGSRRFRMKMELNGFDAGRILSDD